MRYTRKEDYESMMMSLGGTTYLGSPRHDSLWWRGRATRTASSIAREDGFDIVCKHCYYAYVLREAWEDIPSRYRIDTALAYAVISAN